MKFYTSEGISKILELLKTYLTNKFNIVNQDIDGKVDKNGSDRLMTANEGNKLSGIENNAQVNTIESISLNGVNISPDINKNVALAVITNTVDNLTNYYKKDETYTQNEINSLIGAVTTLDIRVVNELPTEDISTITIYLVPAEDPGTQNIKDEYINLTGTTEGWEKIGSTAIDLSDYYTKDEVNTLIGQIDLSVFYTKTETDNLLLSKADLVNGKVPLSELPDIGGKQEVFVFESEDNFPAQGEIDTLYISQASGKSYIWEIVSNEYTFSGSYCTIDNIGGVEAPITMEATITSWSYPTAPPGTWVGFQNNSYPSTEPPYIGVAFDAIITKIGKTAPIAGDKITFYKYNGVTSIIYNSEGTDYDVSDCLYITGGITYGHDLYIVANVNQQFSGIFAGPGAATYRGYQNLERYKVISGEIVQSDWNQETDSAPDYIKNKPELGTAASKDVPESGNASAAEVVMGNDTRLTDARTPAAHTHILEDITDYDYLDPNNYTNYNNLVLTAEPKLKYLYKVNGIIQDNNYIRNISELYSCVENNTEPAPINADLYGNRNCVVTNATAEGHTDKPLVLVIKSANEEDITIPNGYINFTFHVQLNPNEGATIVNNINGTIIKNIIGSTILKADERIVIYTGDSVAFLLKPDKTKINISEALVITEPYVLTTENIITVTVEGQSFAKAQYIEWDNSNIKIDKIYDGYLKDIEFGKYLYNKITSAITQNQADWAQTDPTADNYIKNKPASGNGLPIVIVMPENPTDGQLVVWNGDGDYTEGHTYRYDENKEEWVDVIEDYIYDTDWASQGDISFTGRQFFSGHAMFTSNMGTTEFEGNVSFDPMYGTSEGNVYINTPVIINNSVNPDSSYWNIDESGNANFSSINVNDLYANSLTMEEYNGDINMNGNDLNAVGEINIGGQVLPINGAISVSGNADFNSYNIENVYELYASDLYVGNNLSVSGDLSVSGTITDGSGNSLVYDNDSRLSNDRFPSNNNNLLHTSGNEGYISGTKYFMNGNIAMAVDQFSSSNTYNVGDYTVYQGQLYKCTTTHVESAWNSNHFISCNNKIVVNNDLIANNLITSELSTDTITAQNLKANNYNGYAEYLKALNSSNIELYRFVTIDKDSGYLQYTQADKGVIIGVTTPNALITGSNQSVASGEKNVLVGLLGSFWVTINPDLDSLKPGDYVGSGDSGTADSTTTTSQMRNDIFQVLKVDIENRRCLVLLK